VDSLSASTIKELQEDIERERRARMQTVSEKNNQHLKLRRIEESEKEERNHRQQVELEDSIAEANSHRLIKLNEWKKRLLVRDKQKAKEREQLMALIEIQNKPKQGRIDAESLHEIFERARSIELEERRHKKSSETADALLAIQKIIEDRKLSATRKNDRHLTSADPRYTYYMSKSNYARSTKLACMVYRVYTP
jgi:hypothetical protein